MDQLNIVLVVSFAVSILAFIVAWLLYRWLTGIKVENKRALELSELIRDGSNTFLKREYRYLAYFCFVVACLILLFLPKPIWQEASWITSGWSWPISPAKFSPDWRGKSASLLPRGPMCAQRRLQ